MTRIAAVAFALGLLPLGTLVGSPSIAATPPQAGYIGQAASTVAGCPYLIWRLAKHDDGTITGIVYYSDLSGVSQAKGNIEASGQFQLQLTSAMGNGPVATVNGMKPKTGAASATVKGEGCANAQIALNPVSNLNRIPTASQNSYRG